MQKFVSTGAIAPNRKQAGLELQKPARGRSRLLPVLVALGCLVVVLVVLVVYFATRGAAQAAELVLVADEVARHVFSRRVCFFVRFFPA